MGWLAHAWIGSGRLRRRLAGERRHLDWRARFREDLIRRHAPGRSFADVGCLYGADGAMSFLAEESGATRVTAIDVAEPTPGFEAEHARRDSKVQFVRSDVHDMEAMDRLGPHDVVWCTGVIYHAPNPMLTLQGLTLLTGDVLILGSLTVPEIPGIEQACVFYPMLDERARAPYRRVWPRDAVGLSTPFDERLSETLANFWWGITPSALTAMVRAAGFEVLETHVQHPFDTHVVARRGG